MKHHPHWLIWLGSLAAAILVAWLIDHFGSVGAVVGVGGAFAAWLGVVILRTPRLGLWLIFFSLPFERIPSLTLGGITLRLNFFFGAVTMVSVIGAWAYGKLRGRPNPLTLPIFAYLVAAVASLGGAIEKARGAEVLLFTLFTVAFMLLVINLLRTKDDLKTAIWIILGSSAIVGLFGVYQFLGDAVGFPAALTGLKAGYSLSVLGFPRIQAFSIEPLYLGDYLLLPLSLLVGLVLLRVKPFAQGFRLIWLGLLFGLLSLVLVLTVSRGAYIGAAAAVLVLAVTLPCQIARPAPIILGVVLLALVSSGTYFFLQQGRSDAIAKFEEHVLLGDLGQGESTQGRLSAFQLALNAWTDHPWFGIGLGNFGAYVKNYPDPRDLTGYDIVNNEYLEVLSETGLIGAAALAVALVILLVRSVIAYQATRDPLLRASLAAATATMVGVLAQYNFFSTLYIITIWVFVGLTVAVQNLALAQENPK